jgi:hypothetical protein
VIGHLGTRVSALLDGQLSTDDEERAWDHVHSCHQCRDAVEREGWVKTRLASIQYAGSSAPSASSSLKGSLLVHGLVGGWDAVDHPALAGVVPERRRHLGLAGISSGAVGAAVMGVLALGASPANAPGTLVRPANDPFGTSLDSLVSSVTERDLGVEQQGRPTSSTPLTPHLQARRLAP